ncbi:MAG: 4Fe-4S cluster-binding domain-containing protein [Acidobacteria bacterium]|nr:4Fe-4S cluster-binding domain-containing protein [Acidobacteriota bacterium]
MVRVDRATFAASPREWRDWQWQQRHAVRSLEQLLVPFPRLDVELRRRIEAATKERRFQITPYALSLVELGPDGNPSDKCPLWRQLIPDIEGFPGDEALRTPNWELPEEMVTPIAQHKYPNRIIVRVVNACHSYCQFCFLSHRTLTFTRQANIAGSWRETLTYIERSEEIQEIIFSGGDPFLLGTEQLERLLQDVRRLRRRLVIRIHTRVLAFSPFRVDPALCRLLRRADVGTVVLHATHPRELTPEGRQCVTRLARSVRLLRSHVPLLRGVNDSIEVLSHLLMSLYAEGVSAGYLFHFAPNSPSAHLFETSVRAGADLVRALRRRLPGPAVPEYVVVHPSGKLTVDTSHVSVSEIYGEHARLRALNWRDERIEFPARRAEGWDSKRRTACEERL